MSRFSFYQNEVSKEMRKLNLTTNRIGSWFQSATKEYSSTYSNSVWGQIEAVASNVLTAQSTKLEELNDDIYNLCLRDQDYSTAYSVLIGAPTTFATRVSEALSQKRALFNSIEQTYQQKISNAGSEYTLAYKKYTDALGVAARLSAIPRNPTPAWLNNFRIAVDNAINLGNDVVSVIQRFINIMKNIISQAQTILSNLNGMLSLINSITWTKTNRCGSGGPGAQALTEPMLNEILDILNIEGDE